MREDAEDCDRLPNVELGEAGLEPARSFERGILNPLRLPFRHSPGRITLVGCSVNVHPDTSYKNRKRPGGTRLSHPDAFSRNDNELAGENLDEFLQFFRTETFNHFAQNANIA